MRLRVDRITFTSFVARKLTAFLTPSNICKARDSGAFVISPSFAVSNVGNLNFSPVVVAISTTFTPFGIE
jgi:hypothetical protein